MPLIFGSLDSPISESPGEQIHIYTSKSTAESSDFWGLLTDSERARADRFRVPRIRDQFIQARGALRFLLSRYLKRDPIDVPILLADGGKPYVPAEFGLHFNISHTHGLALFAFAAKPIGVDVEQMRIVPDALGLVQRFFSPREHEQFCRLNENQIPLAFLRAWTRKEAVLKALGRGVQSLDCCEVTFKENDEPAVLSLDGDESVTCNWLLRAWEPESGFQAALALYLAN